MLSYGPVEPADGIPISARCVLLWQASDGVQRLVGYLERIDHPEGGSLYQWSVPRVSGQTAEEVLDAVCDACRDGDSM